MGEPERREALLFFSLFFAQVKDPRARKREIIIKGAHREGAKEKSSSGDRELIDSSLSVNAASERAKPTGLLIRARSPNWGPSMLDTFISEKLNHGEQSEGAKEKKEKEGEGERRRRPPLRRGGQRLRPCESGERQEQRREQRRARGRGRPSSKKRRERREQRREPLP